MKILALLVLLVPTVALAQKPMQELDLQRGPASELYIRKRPPAPEAPVLSKELKDLLTSTETKRDEKRLEAIGLLKAFLASNPTGEVKAEGMFKLAELLWEEARRLYLIKMDDYSRSLERCSQKKGECEQPKEPRIDLHEAEVLYKQLYTDFPNYKRMDLVTYLIGFAEKEDGHEDEAIAKFQEVIAKYPESPLFGDAWMMVGEHEFAAGHWQPAMDAYKHVPTDAATADLATFKTAWCMWKLGDSMGAAEKFKELLDRREKCEHGTGTNCKRTASLAEEALDYLVIVFTEDRSLSPREVYDFLQSIGGDKYSHDVMIKVAESYGAQAEWDRSNDAYRFLIKMEPDSIKAADYQRDIIQNWNTALELDRAQEEIKVLLENYGPTTAWAKAQKNRDALDHSLGITEQLVRNTAMQIHAEAQRREKALHITKQAEGCATKPTLPPDILTLYTRASDAYDEYLTAFAESKLAAEQTQEIRFYRADILCFKMGKVELAGDEYLALGKSSPIGKYHKDALLDAIAAFEAARPKDTAGHRQLYPVDTKFAEAVDLYATLFPADKAIVGVIFKNCQMFFDYSEWDQVIKRCGLIVTKYPTDANAGPAGDRILSALNKASDYENLEVWARKLKEAPSFKAKDKQELLSGLIIQSIQKTGDKYQEAGKYDQAAKFYLRVPKETNDPKIAARYMMNAGAMYEKAKRPEDAADIYLDVAEKFADTSRDDAEKAAFTAGVVYEHVIYYDRAAKAYELVVNKFGKGEKVPDALYNAGLLRQALGQNDKAIQHYKDYAKKYSSRPDASAVAFNIGAVYEDGGQDGPAYQAFTDYARVYKSIGKRLVEAHTRAGLASYRLGQYKRAHDDFVEAEALFKRSNAAEKKEAKTWAAQARYYEGELIFRDYEKVGLDVKPSQLGAALTKKMKLLGEAEKVYFSIADYADPKWGNAALYRDGQIYELFADSLTQAAQKPPAGLTPDQVQAYQDAINEKVLAIQDKAVEAYTIGYNKALQLQLYDEYTAKIREALGRLAAQKYPPEHEARGKVRIGDRPPNPDLIQEVTR
ncbi:MAG TPA: tetratricopeptide repeat protein [Kofleriaceae bacterium]|nr:tetratricopeptide repeat protein [Kofleriaceae bacterium]